MTDLLGLIAFAVNITMIFFVLCIILKINKALTIYIRKNECYDYEKMSRNYKNAPVNEEEEESKETKAESI